MEKEDSEKKFKKSVMKLVHLAESLNLTIAAGVKNNEGDLASFCSEGFNESSLGSNNEELNNIFLMLKSKGDLNQFMLLKSKVSKKDYSDEPLVSLNPQVLSTKH